MLRLEDRTGGLINNADSTYVNYNIMIRIIYTRKRKAGFCQSLIYSYSFGTAQIKIRFWVLDVFLY